MHHPQPSLPDYKTSLDIPISGRSPSPGSGALNRSLAATLCVPYPLSPTVARPLQLPYSVDHVGVHGGRCPCPRCSQLYVWPAFDFRQVNPWRFRTEG
eukprot:9025405-Pyramimonas_sp.AAC.2